VLLCTLTGPSGLVQAARLAPDATLPGTLYPWSSSSRASAPASLLPTQSATAAAVHSRLARAAAVSNEVGQLLDQLQQFMEVHLAVPEYPTPQDQDDDGAISDSDAMASYDARHDDDVQQAAQRLQVIRATVPGVHAGSSFVRAMMAGPAQTAAGTPSASAARHQAGRKTPASAIMSSQHGPQQMSGLQLQQLDPQQQLLWIKDHTPGARRLLGGHGSSPGGVAALLADGQPCFAGGILNVKQHTVAPGGLLRVHFAWMISSVHTSLVR
jgi:hypothetical protein